MKIMMEIIHAIPFFFIIGILTSTALYAIISLLICVFWLEIDFTTIYQATIHRTSFLEWFYAIMIWSLFAYPLLKVIRGFLSNPIGYIRADIASPFRGVMALKGLSKISYKKGFWFWYSWVIVILHFFWSIVFWGFFIWGYINVFKIINLPR